MGAQRMGAWPTRRRQKPFRGNVCAPCGCEVEELVPIGPEKAPIKFDKARLFRMIFARLSQKIWGLTQ